MLDIDGLVKKILHEWHGFSYKERQAYLDKEVYNFSEVGILLQRLADGKAKWPVPKFNTETPVTREAILNAFMYGKANDT